MSKNSRITLSVTSCIAALLVYGCSCDQNPPAGHKDLAVADGHAVDSATHDLRGADLFAQKDQATNNDLSDTAGDDLSTSTDDMAAPDDLAMAQDLTMMPRPDLVVTGDLSGACVPQQQFAVEQLGGMVWGPINAVWGTGDNDIYLGSLWQSAIIHYDGNGWSQFSLPSNPGINGVWGTDANNVWAAGGTVNGSAVYYSSGGVNQWVQQTLPNGLCKCDLYSIWGSSANDLYVTGASGTLVHSANHGTTWEIRDPGTKDFLYGIWGSGPNDIYMAGTLGIYHSTDLGMTWPMVYAGTFEGVWGSDANNVFAVGTPGLIVRSTDGGKTWKTEATGVPMSGLTSVWGSGPTDVWVVGSEDFATNSSTVLHSCGNGIWARVPIPGLGGGFNASDFKSIWGSSPLNVYGGTTAEILLHLH